MPTDYVTKEVYVMEIYTPKDIFFHSIKSLVKEVMEKDVQRDMMSLAISNSL